MIVYYLCLTQPVSYAKDESSSGLSGYLIGAAVIVIYRRLYEHCYAGCYQREVNFEDGLTASIHLHRWPF